jgi:Nucleotidyl transferase AbiEii toxin, Type IV TA system
MASGGAGRNVGTTTALPPSGRKMNTVFQAAVELQQFCDARAWRFCFIGGVAVQRWGQPRVTDDVDLTLLTGWEHEEIFLDELLKRYRLRPKMTRRQALASRVAFLINTKNVPIDIALGAVPFEERSIRRSSIWSFDGRNELRTCSAEDLIVHKCFAGRGHDWSDVESVIVRQGAKLDLKLIRKELRPLAEIKANEDILAHLKRIIRRSARRKNK